MGRPATGGVRFEGGRWKARLTVAGREKLVPIEPPLTRDPEDRPRAVIEARAMAGLVRDSQSREGELAEEWFDRWLLDKKARGQTAWKASRSHITVHVLPVLRGTPIAAVSKRQLEAVVERLDRAVAAGELKWKAASNVWSTVTKAFDDAKRSKTVDLRVRDDDPTKDVRGPDRGVATAKVHLYPGEFLQLVSAPHETVPQRRRRFYALGVYCYMRPSEVEALRWEDIDLSRGTIHIRRGLSDAGEETSPKAGRARLPFDLEANLLPLLHAMHAERSTGLVVGPVAARYWERAELLRADLLAAGVMRRELHEGSKDPPREWMTAHDLRTTGITWMAVEGVRAPFEVMARAGHASLEQTREYIDAAQLVRRGYGSVFPELPASLLDRVSGEVSGGGSDSSRENQGLSVEDMGIEPRPRGLSMRAAATISIRKRQSQTGAHQRKPAETTVSPETSPEIHPARAAYVEQVHHAIGKAIERGDWAAVVRLAEALAGEARAVVVARSAG